MRALVLLAASAALAVACGTRSSETVAERAGVAVSPIVNGVADTTHQAVVAVVLQSGSQGGLCSGTIVKVDPSTKIGWVLTAAHCVEIPPVIVLQTDDLQSPTALKYQILDYAPDPRYQLGGDAGQLYDVAVVRVAGVDATTPILPLVSSPDGVSAGTPVVAVGYGRTTLTSSGTADANTVRRKVSLGVAQVTNAQLAYDMSARGFCQGDSGGPDLVASGGVEKVAGVHSYVQGDCNGTGVSGRVAGNRSFIDAQLAKTTAPTGCGFCEAVASSGNGECARLTSACLADQGCKAFYDCLGSCGGTSSCKTACLAKFPMAEGPFMAAAGCVCARACIGECGSTLSCRGVPKCGYKFPAGECSTCTEGACCQEALDCGADGQCYSCLKSSDADPACATNAARKKLASCVASRCAQPCAGTGLDTNAEVPPADEGAPADGAAASTTSTTTSGCSIGRAGDGVRSPLAWPVGPLGLALGLALRRRRCRAVRAARVVRAPSRAASLDR